VSVIRTLRALPTLFRVGVAETVAYRGEFLVWLLVTTMPLVQLGLWSSVADEAPFGDYTSDKFVAYYLCVMIVRNLTGTWVAWQISEEVRTGQMAMRLLRPLHPYLALAARHAAAIPFRSVVALPFAVILLVSSGASALTTAPMQLVAILPSILIAWLITFNMMFSLGAIGFFITKTMALTNLYFALFTLLSGYLIPIDLMPSVIGDIARVLPMRFTLSVPVEIMTTAMSTQQLLELLAAQLGWLVATLALALWVWSRGIKRFESVGG